MSEPEEQSGGELFDAPNQQAVGLDPPWVEGTGGGGDPAPAPHDDEEPRSGTTVQPVPDSGTEKSDTPAPPRRRKGGDEG